MTRDPLPEVTRTLTIDASEDYGRKLLDFGSQIGPYTIDEVAAVGGFGVVYRASEHTGKLVAIKVLHPSFASVLSALGRFQREVQLVERSRHPNIVEILAFGELDNGSPYLVMEWLDGNTLSEVVKEHGPMDLTDALTVMEGLSSALAAVHAAGVVHRDLKGSNVMVLNDDRKQVKLLDFGIAKMLDQGVTLTRTGAPIGTPGYMAPEQLRGHRVGPPADIYSLGILLFIMLTGEHPQDYWTESQTSFDIAASLPTSLSERLLDANEVFGVPNPITEIIARCTNLEPYQRYPSIEEMMEELRHAITDASTSATGTSQLDERTHRDRGVELGAQRPEGSRPINSLRTQLKTGAAIYFDVDPADSNEAAEICQAEGFTVSCKDESSFLAVITLPDDEPAAQAVRQRVVRLALRVVRQLDSQDAGCSATIHVAPAVMLVVDATPQLTGGELLALDRWLQRAPSGSALATEAALSGLDQSFAVEPAARGMPGYFLVRDRDGPCREHAL